MVAGIGAGALLRALPWEDPAAQPGDWPGVLSYQGAPP
jgi:hypothetical protein